MRRKVAAEIHFFQLATDFYEWMGEILSGGVIIRVCYWNRIVFCPTQSKPFLELALDPEN